MENAGARAARAAADASRPEVMRKSELYPGGDVREFSHVRDFASAYTTCIRGMSDMQLISERNLVITHQRVNRRRIQTLRDNQTMNAVTRLQLWYEPRGKRPRHEMEQERQDLMVRNQDLTTQLR